MTDGYANVNGFIVILADNRDPYVSWQNHLDRGSAGGVDCVAPIGTPIYAPADCYLANTPNNGTGGNTITMSFNDGWRDQMMHLSQFVTPGAKRRGEVVGWSGDSGSPGAPHVHWHRIDPTWQRRNPWDYFTGTAPAGDGYTPIQEDDMYDDAARYEVVSRLDQLIGELRSHAARQSMPTYELVRSEADPQVWFAVDRLQRVRVPDAATLADYKYFITKTGGQSSSVRIVSNLAAFGAPVN
jgi:hypothetical protein